MAREEHVLLGRSKRAIERRLFGKALRITLDKSADPVTRKIVNAYSKAWASVRGLTAEMAEVAAEQRHTLGAPSPREIARMDRVDRAQFALARQIRELSKFTGVQVTGGAESAIGRTVSTVLDQIPHLTGVDRRFTKPSGGAMEGLILRSTGQIEASTRSLDAAQQVALKEGLFRGLVLGQNPKETARHIVAETEGAFFGGLSRARTLARTEISDAHRYATRLAYGEEDLVVGWKWLAQLSNRTCPACWAMHDSFHDKTEMQFGHQNCRCTTVPVLADDMPADNDLGDPEELFWGLPREDQLQIMGPGRLKALEAGAPFSALTFLKHNPGWRPSQVVTNVADLQGMAELRLASVPGDVITIPGQTNASLMDAAYRQGGLTIHAMTGEQPTSGYVVARQGTSEVIDARTFFSPSGSLIVADWMLKHGDALDAPGAHLGMWYDTANGKVVLDVVEILNDRDAAVALGRAEDQIAIFDLNTFTEIATGGTGGYADPLSSALRPDGVSVGKTVTVNVDGAEVTGRVIRTPDFSDVTVIETSDGKIYRAWPDQFTRVDVSMDAEVERAMKVADIVDDIARSTGMRVNLAGMSVETAEATRDSIKQLMAEYPDVDPLSLVTGDGGGAFAVTSTGFRPAQGMDPSLVTTPLVAESDIFIADEYATDPARWRSDMEGAENRGHFHPGTSDSPVDYTIDHEFGHVLDNNLWGDPRTYEGNRARRTVAVDIHNALLAEEIERGDIAPATVDNLPDAWQGIPALIERELSGYSNVSPAEMFAEAFAVYRDHGPGRSIVADTVMRHMMRAYRKKYGRWPSERDLDRLLGDEYQPPEQGRLW